MVGLSNVWIALSADHGVAPNPGFIRQHHLGLGNAQVGKIKDAVERALSETFGAGQWVDFLDFSYLYLNPATLKRRGIESAKAEAAAAEAVVSVPGVEAAFTRTQLLSGSAPSTPLAAKVFNSFNQRRSGDIFIVLEPFAVPVEGDSATTHGEPWTYDTQVPLLLWGSAFKPGIYTQPCQPIDLAPTLAAALGITQPSGAQGRPLVPALK
jgi:arylsulfatase A-like enzyme